MKLLHIFTRHDTADAFDDGNDCLSGDTSHAHSIHYTEDEPSLTVVGHATCGIIRCSSAVNASTTSTAANAIISAVSSGRE